MKKFILGLLLAAVSLVSVPTVKAQTSVLVGVNGTNELNNLSAGIAAGLETTIHNRLMIAPTFTYSPYESHVGLGLGHADIASLSTTAWFGNTGITGRIEDSGYSVTKVSKAALYAAGGVTLKRYFLTVPTRFGFGYVQQINNGIVNGIETSHLHGVYFSVDGRPFCAKSFCLRFQEQFVLGHTLNQGNPVCDGTIGNGSQVGFNPCPRHGAIGGGVSLNVFLDFHKNANSNDLF